jgi:hypothetical protein
MRRLRRGIVVDWLFWGPVALGHGRGASELGSMVLGRMRCVLVGHVSLLGHLGTTRSDGLLTASSCVVRHGSLALGDDRLL